MFDTVNASAAGTAPVSIASSKRRVSVAPSSVVMPVSSGAVVSTRCAGSGTRPSWTRAASVPADPLAPPPPAGAPASTAAPVDAHASEPPFASSVSARTATPAADVSPRTTA